MYKMNLYCIFVARLFGDDWLNDNLYICIVMIYLLIDCLVLVCVSLMDITVLITLAGYVRNFNELICSWWCGQQSVIFCRLFYFLQFNCWQPLVNKVLYFVDYCVKFQMLTASSHHSIVFCRLFCKISIADN